MHTIIIKGPDVGSIRKYERLITKRLHTFDIIELDNLIPWSNGNVEPAFLKKIAAGIYKKRGVSVDAIQIFINPRDWHNKKIRGRHYNKRRSGYQVSITKHDRLYARTADHEDMHKYDNIVRIYTGTRLEDVVGVTDWDDDVVHGEDSRFTRYEHETPYDMIYKHLNKALIIRKRTGIISALELLIQNYRELLINMQKRDHVVVVDTPKTTGEKLYDTMLASVGVDASPADLAPDELGCAETVSTIIKKVLPSFRVITGTWTLWDMFRKSSEFMLVDTPEPGDIIISPTGMSSKGSRAPFVGHAGFIGKRRKIYSNDSYSGLFEQNYTIDHWTARYQVDGGYPIYYFRAK